MLVVRRTPHVDLSTTLCITTPYMCRADYTDNRYRSRSWSLPIIEFLHLLWSRLSKLHYIDTRSAPTTKSYPKQARSNHHISCHKPLSPLPDNHPHTSGPLSITDSKNKAYSLCLTTPSIISAPHSTVSRVRVRSNQNLQHSRLPNSVSSSRSARSTPNGN